MGNYDYVATDEEMAVYMRLMRDGTLDRGLDYTKKEAFTILMMREKYGGNNK
jgi:hypothetical protein